MRTLLITGGAGFIGSAFVRRTLAVPDPLRSETPGTAPRGPYVVNLDKLTYAGHLDSLADALDDPRHVFVRGDIADPLFVAALLAEHRPETIVHFAAESHVDRSIDGPAEFVSTNVVGTATLLEAARDYWERLRGPARAAFRFLHVSTDEVYGSVDAPGCFRESSHYRPNSPYAASKAAADHFARAYHRTYGLPIIVTHSTNNYGPCQHPEKLIPLMIRRALAGRALPIHGDGGQVRDWLYVEDHCRALELVLKGGRPGEVYNVGASSQRTNLQVVHGICTLLDGLCPDLPRRPCAELIRFVADRPGQDRRYAVDASKLRRELGWRPQMDFEAGLERTVRWYLDHPDWPRGAAARPPRWLGRSRRTIDSLVPDEPADVAFSARCST
jgi:dTDP-glucose 4,6-dehydratase